MDTISVIVPCYNVEAYLKRCVDSITNQTYQNLDIILVDDGSTDETGKLCDSIAQTDSRIRVVHKENGGLSDARNAGIDVAKGEFYAFVDGDDYLEKNAYEVMSREMNNPDISLVSAGIVVEDIAGNVSINMSQDYLVLNREQALKNLLGPVRTIAQSSCNKLFRRQLFHDLRYKKGIINEDAELLPKLLDACRLVVLLNKPVYHYIRRKGSITESAFSVWKYQGVSIAYDTLTFCEQKYPQLKSYAHYYVMDALFKTYGELISSNNRSAFRKQEGILRAGMVREYFQCVRQRNIMEECGNRVKSIAITAFFGDELTKKLVHMKQRLMKEKGR